MLLVEINLLYTKEKKARDSLAYLCQSWAHGAGY